MSRGLLRTLARRDAFSFEQFVFIILLQTPSYRSLVICEVFSFS
jgi:hypothetical protein